MPKLNYKIVGRRRLEGETLDLENVDVEWTHADGPVTDTHILPKTHPPDIQYEEEAAGQRKVIHDCISVKTGTPDSIIMQMLEEKRARLAANLGVSA